MSFLTRTPDMTLRESRQILSLDESITYCQLHGPMSLETYARIWAIPSEFPKSWERHLRRLVKQLGRLGFTLQVPSTKEAGFRIDAAVDEALAAVVKLDAVEAGRFLQRDETSSGQPTAKANEDAPWLEISTDRKNGATLRRLCARYGIGRERARSILEACGVGARPARPLRVEEKRCAAVVKKAVEVGSSGSLKDVARVLGCSRETARAFLRRAKMQKRGKA